MPRRQEERCSPMSGIHPSTASSDSCFPLSRDAGDDPARTVRAINPTLRANDIGAAKTVVSAQRESHAAWPVAEGSGSGMTKATD